MSRTPPKYETFHVTLTPDGVAVIAFNRPKRANALNDLAYKEWLAAMNWAADSSHVKVVVLTGNGRFYTSGQELAIPDNETDLEKQLRQMILVEETLVKALINFPKLLIAAVNGPAVGFGVTTLALCDIVYSVPDATFNTPFMQLGFCAEACSSYLFPKIFGPAIANEFLLMGRKFTALELEKYGFISRIISPENFLDEVLKYATKAAKYPQNAMQQTKELVRICERETLEQVNARENKLLIERMLSDESQQAVMEFVMAKKNHSKL